MLEDIHYIKTFVYAWNVFFRLLSIFHPAKKKNYNKFELANFNIYPCLSQSYIPHALSRMRLHQHDDWFKGI